MILILTGINLLTYFKGKVTTMLVANSRELRFIIIGSDFKWESIMAAKTKMFAVSGRAWPMWRGLPSIDLNRNISQASLLLCKHNKKLHKSNTSNLKHETRMIYTQKRIRIRNSLDGGTDKMSLGTATKIGSTRLNSSHDELSRMPSSA